MAQANIKAVITAEDKASRTLQGFSQNVEGMGHKISTAMKVAAAAIAAAGTAALVLGIKTAAELETAEQGFKTLLGSADAAGRIMERIKQEAKRTPFEVTGLTQATQLLSAVTKDGDRALNFVLDIGEGLAAMGRGQAELDRISVNLQQIAATGRAFSIDIRQFAFAGIPIYEMLQEEIGLTGEALNKFIEDGGVTFEMLEGMFQRATDEGGRWAGAFENQAGTFNQVVSNMKDSFKIFLSDLVNSTGAFNIVKEAMKGLTGIMEGNNQTVNRWRDSFARVAEVVFGYLRPHLEALWNNIKNDLIPTFQRFWKEILQPMLPVLGVLLVAAIRGVINALNILMDVQASVMDSIILMKSIVVGQWNIIVGTVRTVIGWVQSLGNWWAGLPGVVRGALSGVGAVIAAPFKAGFDAIIRGIEFVISNFERLKRAAREVADINSRVTKSVSGGVMKVLDPLGLLPGRASGGPVTGGSPYMVGEKGPELFVPNQSGTIVPNQSVAGNTTVNVNVNVGMYAGTEMEKRKMAQELMRAFQDVAASQNMSWGTR